MPVDVFGAVRGEARLLDPAALVPHQLVKPLRLPIKTRERLVRQSFEQFNALRVAAHERVGGKQRPNLPKQLGEFAAPTNSAPRNASFEPWIRLIRSPQLLKGTRDHIPPELLTVAGISQGITADAEVHHQKTLPTDPFR
jgi:hypothetical protein